MRSSLLFWLGVWFVLVLYAVTDIDASGGEESGGGHRKRVNKDCKERRIGSKYEFKGVESGKNRKGRKNSKKTTKVDDDDCEPNKRNRRPLMGPLGSHKTKTFSTRNKGSGKVDQKQRFKEAASKLSGAKNKVNGKNKGIKSTKVNKQSDFIAEDPKFSEEEKGRNKEKPLKAEALKKIKRKEKQMLKKEQEEAEKIIAAEAEHHTEDKEETEESSSSSEEVQIVVKKKENKSKKGKSSGSREKKVGSGDRGGNQETDGKGRKDARNRSVHKKRQKGKGVTAGRT